MSTIVWHSCAPWAASLSGYGTQTAIWVQKLKEMGHDVYVSTFYGLSGAPTEWNGIPILPGFGQNYCSASLGEHCRRIDPDLVITLGDIWVLDPGVLRQIPVAHWLPSDCRPMSTADRNVLEQSYPQLIAMSQFGYERFAREGFAPVYVPHGINLDIFKRSRTRDADREKMEISDSFVIGMNSANNDAIRKAIPEAMLAFAKFHRDHPEAILSLHTYVHQDGGQDLEFLAESLGISDVVRVADQYRYVSGIISEPDMAQWYSTLDVLNAASYGEGFGLPIVEAQACGVPVIATDASSMAELNPHGISVTGEPFWNGVHRGWWIRPSVNGLYHAFSEAYERRNDVDHGKLREFASGYEVNHVAETYMGPAVEELIRRIDFRLGRERVEQ